MYTLQICEIEKIIRKISSKLIFFASCVCMCYSDRAYFGGGGASSSRIKAGVCLDMYPRRAERRPLEKKKSGYGYVRGRVYPFSLLAVY